MPHSAASGATLTDHSGFAEDVAYYLSLTPRQLPSRYLYDDLGSVLFEAITRLPWYRISNAENHLLSDRAGDILSRMRPLSTIVELGPGSGKKLATLVGGADFGAGVTLHLVDVSPTALAAATNTLKDQADLLVVTHHAPYEVGLAEVTGQNNASGRTLALFLGSNIGNFDPPSADALLSSVRAALADGDALLLGADLVKPEPELLLAYDDPLGVTAAFNRNLLVRANRELGADFDVGAFEHSVVWNASESRIEMHLVSTAKQRVRVPAAGLDVTFEPGETIWTESSHKYHPGEVSEMLGRAGFRPIAEWVQDAFALTLAEVR